MRNLDRTIAKLARKSAKEYLDTPWEGVRTLDERAIRDLLGVPPFRDDKAEKEPQVGLSHGLAWTSIGGVTLDIEAVAVPGKGKLSLTGQLGDVMKESAQAGIAYLRKHSAHFNIPEDFYENRDLHIHVLEGATPKDGPSAGIAMATAVVSALTGRPVRGDIAMTGEITLRGRVLPIGGVKEKLLAAHQAGIQHVIIPDANEANLERRARRHHGRTHRYDGQELYRGLEHHVGGSRGERLCAAPQRRRDRRFTVRASLNLTSIRAMKNPRPLRWGSCYGEV